VDGAGITITGGIIGDIGIGVTASRIGAELDHVAAPGLETWRLVFSQVARLFSGALDRADHAVMVGRCRVVDLIFGPEPPTPADEQREVEHERLQKAFSDMAFDETPTGVDEKRHARAMLTTDLTASDAISTRPSASVNPPEP